MAVFSAISGEHWSLRKGSLQYAIVPEIVSKGQSFRGRSPTSCLESMVQILSQFGDTVQHWLGINEARAHDARPLLAKIRTDKDFWILEKISAGVIHTTRIGKMHAGQAGEVEFPTCIHISGESIRAARWLPDSLITETFREQRRELFKQDLRAASIWANGNNGTSPENIHGEGGGTGSPHELKDHIGDGLEGHRIP